MVNDFTLFVLISAFAGYILFGLMSSGQKIRHISVHELLASSEEDTIFNNTHHILVDGWHIKTLYDVEIVNGIVGGEAVLAMLSSTKARDNQIGGQVDDLLAMPNAVDGAGSGAVLSHMAPVMPSFVFLDTANLAGITYHLSKTHNLRVENKETMNHLVRLNDVNNNLTAGALTITTTTIILVGCTNNHGAPNQPRNANGSDVVIMIMDPSAIVFGSWLPFCTGRMGSIRTTYFGPVATDEEVFLFGPDVPLAVTIPDEDGEKTSISDGDVILLNMSIATSASLGYSTNFKRGPWFIKEDVPVNWASEQQESTIKWFLIEFVFIPDYGATFTIAYKWESLEVDTADFEEWNILPFDSYIKTMDFDVSVVGTSVGILEVLIKIIKADAGLAEVVRNPSVTSIGGSILSDPGQFTRVEDSSIFEVIKLAVNSLETSADTFVGAADKDGITKVFDFFQAGAQIGIYLEGADSFNLNHLEFNLLVHGESRVKSSYLGGNFIESDVIAMEHFI